MQDVTDLNNIPKAKYAYLADGTKLGVKDRMSRNGYEYYGSDKTRWQKKITRPRPMHFAGIIRSIL